MSELQNWKLSSKSIKSISSSTRSNLRLKESYARRNINFNKKSILNIWEMFFRDEKVYDGVSLST